LKKNFPRILVCPLDWGIGHATRCVPVIRKLQEKNAEVIIGADGRSFDFLKNYFPGLEFIRMPGVAVSYPSSGNMALKIALQIPKILSGIRKENRLVKKIIKEHNIDVVISDNRFGIWSNDIYSIYITHQVRIKAPKGWGFVEPLLSRIHSQFWKNCGECWIPDYPDDPNLSGDLGHPRKISPNCHYIGPLSRFSSFSGEKNINNSSDDAGILILLSGPEPQRSIFEHIILDEFRKHPEKKAILLRGLPGLSDKTNPLPNVTMFSHLPDAEIARLIQSAKVIVCRPGYSTLMDLASLGKSAILVPTPGQTEQEYLAEYHASGGAFACLVQKVFSLEAALRLSSDLAPFTLFRSEQNYMDERIKRLSEAISYR
jgi:uncharacterized protein (TIGR00661 family)